MKEIRGYLEGKGYKQYLSPFKKRDHHNSQMLFQKKVISDSVCDLNEKLSVNIDVSDILINDKLVLFIEASITAEKKSIWYELKAYSLTKKDLLNRLDEIEENLIRMFNIIE